MPKVLKPKQQKQTKRLPNLCRVNINLSNFLTILYFYWNAIGSGAWFAHNWLYWFVWLWIPGIASKTLSFGFRIRGIVSRSLFVQKYAECKQWLQAECRQGSYINGLLLFRQRWRTEWPHMYFVVCGSVCTHSHANAQWCTYKYLRYKWVALM